MNTFPRHDDYIASERQEAAVCGDLLADWPEDQPLPIVVPGITDDVRRRLADAAVQILQFVELPPGQVYALAIRIADLFTSGEDFDVACEPVGLPSYLRANPDRADLDDVR